MSLEDQGRQLHGWFGTGTAGGRDDAAARVAAAALKELSGSRRAEFARYLGKGGFNELESILLRWADSSGLKNEVFRQFVIRSGLSVASADAVKRAGVSYAAGDTAGAGSGIAEAVRAGGGSWRFGFRWARDLAGVKVARSTRRRVSYPANSIDELPTDQAVELAAAADDPQGLKVVRSIVTAVGLDRNQQQALHRAISGQGYSYEEVKAIAIAIKLGEW